LQRGNHPSIRKNRKREDMWAWGGVYEQFEIETKIRQVYLGGGMVDDE